MLEIGQSYVLKMKMTFFRYPSLVRQEPQQELRDSDLRSLWINAKEDDVFIILERFEQTDRYPDIEYKIMFDNRIFYFHFTESQSNWLLETKNIVILE